MKYDPIFRIHETNLKKQGMLTLTFNKADYDLVRPDDNGTIVSLGTFAPFPYLTLSASSSTIIPRSTSLPGQ